jgi:hypothetical protein
MILPVTTRPGFALVEDMPAFKRTGNMVPRGIIKALLGVLFSSDESPDVAAWMDVRGSARKAVHSKVPKNRRTLRWSTQGNIVLLLIKAYSRAFHLNSTNFRTGWNEKASGKWKRRGGDHLSATGETKAGNTGTR